jgi:hypothetical protein
MALLVDKLFITKDAFDKYRDVSEHLDADRADASILEAQISDLIQLTGAPLYSLLQTDFTAPSTWATTKYEKLFNGTLYTPVGEKYEIRYHGLQPMLSLFAYSRFLGLAQLNLTRTGPVVYTEVDVSEAPTQAQIKTKVIDARAMAVRYQEECITYLESNSSDFPEWSNPYIKNKAFNFIKL